MKRRKFLTAAALSLLGGSALAAPAKPVAKPAGKPAPKPITKPGTKPGAKPPLRGASKPTATVPIRRQPMNTADHSVIDAPPPGSSASRLPPVKAPDLPELWQDFEVTTTITIKASRGGPQKLWLPLPLNQNTLYQRNLGHEWQGNAESLKMQRLPDGAQEILCATWSAGEEARLTLINRVSIAERIFDVTRRSMPPEREDILRHYLRETPNIPNEGEIYELATKIVSRIKDPVAQAKAMFEWVAENTAYLSDLPGGGSGDVKEQVRTGRFGGGSVDIASLFVGLCRSMGIPARLVFGLRVDRSLLHPSLSATPDDLRREQHCRAEFYIPGYNWIPVDPADASKASTKGVMNSRDLASLRRVLFGTWEMNWMAYSMASNFVLPGTSSTVPFLNVPLLSQAGDYKVAHLSDHPALKQLQIKSQRTLSSF